MNDNGSWWSLVLILIIIMGLVIIGLHNKNAKLRDRNIRLNEINTTLTRENNSLDSIIEQKCRAQTKYWRSPEWRYWNVIDCQDEEYSSLRNENKKLKEIISKNCRMINSLIGEPIYDCRNETNIIVRNDIIVGRARIIDGDTIEINNRRIRLHGIDSFEKQQVCLDEKGNTYNCGQKAIDYLTTLINNQIIKCIVLDQGFYKRDIAECSVNNVNINESMVSNGWAIAYTQYSTKYVSSETQAKNHSVGVWRGDFTKPNEYRKLPKEKRQSSTRFHLKSNN